MTESSLQYCIPLAGQKPRYMTLVPTDLGSRYKTRQLQIQIQGKSKMIKTVLVNVLDVAKDMQIPPTYVGTFMGYEIGAQSHFDTKKPERQQAYLSGDHEPKLLSKYVEQFINEVLLCPGCGLPETNIYVEKKEVVGKCRACPANSPLSITNPKFKNYILNHPPSQSGNVFAGGKAAQSEKKLKKNKKAGSDEENRDEEEEDEENKEEDAAEVERKVKEAVIVEKKKNSDDKVEWFSDTSEEARKKRREAMIPDALTEKMVQREKREAEMKKILEKHPVDTAALDSFKKEFQSNEGEFVALLAAEIFAGKAVDENFIKVQAPLLKKYCSSDDTELVFLKVLETTAIGKPEMLSNYAKLLHVAYDGEIVDEDSIQAWYSACNSPAKEKAAPLIKWFNKTEEEEGEE